MRTDVPPNEKEYLDQAEAAALIGVHVNTMVKLGRSGEGPPRARVGPRLVRYRRSDLVGWMESRKEGAE